MDADDVELVGTIAADSEEYDRDIYELGPAYAGDGLLIDLVADATDDIVLGLFDDQERILAYIDPASATSGPKTIDIILHETTSKLYVVIDTRSGSADDRSYSARVTVQRGGGIPTSHPQVVILNFNGGEDVRIGYRQPVDVPPFDAANIDSRFSGQTETIIDYLMDMVRDDYEGLNIEIYRDTDPSIPEGEHSNVYFGTYDSRLLGLAENIDPYNTDGTQSAILYTDTFSVFNVFSPDTYTMAQILANVASHEVGHLLGLRHTADPSDLMDVTASARQMMFDQWFSVAELDSTVMSIGTQDSPTMLTWSVGGQLMDSGKNRRALRQRTLEAAGQADDFYIPRWKLTCCSCPTCSDPQEPENQPELH